VAIADDGSRVAVLTAAPGLVPGDTAVDSDVFVWDRAGGGLRRLTSGDAGDRSDSGPSVSADGGLVAYSSDAGPVLWDAATGAETVLPNEDGRRAATVVVSPDGSTVAWDSYLSHYDSGGSLRIDTSDLVSYDRGSGETTLVASDAGFWHDPSLSADGSTIAFVGDRPDASLEVQVWSAGDGSTRSVAPVGAIHDLMPWASPSVSDDGRFVVFASGSSQVAPADLTGGGDTYLWDATAGGSSRIVEADLWTRRTTISADGRHVGLTDSSSLVPPPITSTHDGFVWSRTD